jgi:hypothetical protein
MKVGRGRCDFAQEHRVGPRPCVANRQLVEHLDQRGLAIHQKIDRRTYRRERVVGCDVFPIKPQILGGERLTIRPAMTLAQPEGEDAAVFDGEVGQDVRHKLEILVVADEPGVAVDVEQARVPGAAHQHPHVAATVADLGNILKHTRLVRRPG